MPAIKSILRVSTLIIVVATSFSALAAVVSVGVQGFEVETVVQVAAGPKETFSALVDDLPKWWDPEHTFSGTSLNLVLEPQENGCFCEKLPQGGGIRHAAVVRIDPPRRLVLEGALGPLQEHGVSGALTFQIRALDSGSELKMTYRVGGFIPSGFDSLAPVVDVVLALQVARLKAFVETARPAAP